MQARRADSCKRHRHTTGSSVNAGYLLTGLGFCGVCEAKLHGYTCISRRGIKTKYYVCSGRHRGGDHGACPKYYRVPGKPFEDRILALVMGLDNHPDLAKYIADEFAKINRVDGDRQANLTRRLADLDQQQAKLSEHIMALDFKAAQGMGFYDKARTLAQEREEVEGQLKTIKPVMAELPELEAVRLSIAQGVGLLRRALEAGSLEEKRDVIACYVQRFEAFPDAHKCASICIWHS